MKLKTKRIRICKRCEDEFTIDRFQGNKVYCDTCSRKVFKERQIKYLNSRFNKDKIKEVVV